MRSRIDPDRHADTLTECGRGLPRISDRRARPGAGSGRRSMMRASVRAGVLLALLLVSAFMLPGTVRGQAPQAGDPSAEPSAVPSHDWRAPGFVAVVDGRLFDPDCWPLISVGS